MLWTRWAAFVGASTTHQTMNATASHFRIVPSFTAASLEAQTAPSCQFLNSRPKRGLVGGPPSRYGSGHAGPNGTNYARISRALRMARSGNAMSPGYSAPTCGEAEGAPVGAAAGAGAAAGGFGALNNTSAVSVRDWD